MELTLAASLLTQGFKDFRLVSFVWYLLVDLVGLFDDVLTSVRGVLWGAALWQRVPLGLHPSCQCKESDVFMHQKEVLPGLRTSAF